MIIIGIDEAGYGPNLGPLVIGASIWRVPRSVDLYQELSAVVSCSPEASDGRLVIADSKKIHRPHQGLQRLEQCVLPVAHVPNAWEPSLKGTTLLDRWDPRSSEDRRDLPWYGEWRSLIPLYALSQEIVAQATRFQHALDATGIRLCGIQTRSLEPATFNRQVESRGSKGSVLSSSSVEFVRDLLSTVPEEPALVQCDKHGGRNRYANLLQDTFELPQVRVQEESQQVSRYAFTLDSRTVEVTFRVQGEANLPTAVASMCAKYHRELAMVAWNQYWCSRQPGLRPTAGYPLDARRFYAEIEPLLSPLRIGRDTVWRNR